MFLGSECCPYPLLHRDFVVVADGVFTQEVKLHHELLSIVLWVKFDVLDSQRAAAHGVGRLSFLLLVTRSQRQLEHIRTAGLTKDIPSNCRPAFKHLLNPTHEYLKRNYRTMNSPKLHRVQTMLIVLVSLTLSMK